MIAFVIGELDIQHHPHHVPYPRCKSHNYHGEQHEVPECGICLADLAIKQVELQIKQLELQAKEREIQAKSAESAMNYQMAQESREFKTQKMRMPMEHEREMAGVPAIQAHLDQASQALQALLEGQNRLSETVSKRRIKRVVRGPDNRISHAIEELEP